MINPKTLDDLARKVADAIPSPVSEFRNDVEKNLRAALQNSFTRLNLVTREEFDAQSKVLARAREQLTALEAQVRALESQLAATTTQRGQTDTPDKT